MTWLTWRQHRGEAVGVAAVLCLVGGIALVTGLPMHRSYERDGLGACLAADRATEACMRIISSFRADFGGLPMQVAGGLNFLPLLAGILIGAPFLAREYEQGTWQLAWTQAVPRTRWLIAKLGLVLTGVTLAAVALGTVLQWWLRPLEPSAFSPERFNHAAPVLASYFLLAIAIGVFAGTVMRRAVPAMAVTLAAFLPIRLFVELGLRPNYMEPIVAVDPVPGSQALVQQVANGNNWVLDEFVVGPSGNRLTDAEEYDIFGGGRIDGTAEADLGLREGITYQPASRFWEFQLIETAIFGGLAFILLFLVVRHVRR